MCYLFEVFVPLRHKQAMRFPEGADHFTAVSTGTQKDLMAEVGNRNGAYLGLGCICGLKDWSGVLSEIMRLERANRSTWVLYIRYWSKDRYEVRAPRELSVEDLDVRQVPEEGVLHKLNWCPDRPVLERMERPVVLELRTGESIRGVLKSFDPVGRFGVLDRGGSPWVFPADQVVDVLDA